MCTASSHSGRIFGTQDYCAQFILGVMVSSNFCCDAAIFVFFRCKKFKKKDFVSLYSCSIYSYHWVQSQDPGCVLAVGAKQLQP